MGLFGLFKKKTTVTANESDSGLVEKFPAKMDVLIASASSEESCEKLRAFRAKVEYLSVSPKEEVLKLDRKINDALDDLKIVLAKKESDDKIDDGIKNLEILLAQRAVIYQ